MGTAGWVFLVIAIIAIAALIIVLVKWKSTPTDAKLLKAIDDANLAKRRAEAQERLLTAQVEQAKKELATISAIKNDKDRLMALADFANRMKRR